jgi:hypothetical protein
MLAGVLTLYYVRKVSESEIWEERNRRQGRRHRKAAALRSARGKSGRNLLQVLLMMTGFWLTQNIITIFLPTGLLVKTLHLSGFQMTATLHAHLFRAVLQLHRFGDDRAEDRPAPLLRDRRAADRDGRRGAAVRAGERRRAVAVDHHAAGVRARGARHRRRGA